MDEFSKANVEKLLKELRSKLNKNNQDIEDINKKMALDRINNNNKIYNDETSKITKLSSENNDLKKEIDYILSGKKETDYILNTCNLIHQYMDLEDLEKELIMQEDRDIEQ